MNTAEDPGHGFQQTSSHSQKLYPMNDLHKMQQRQINLSLWFRPKKTSSRCDPILTFRQTHCSKHPSYQVLSVCNLSVVSRCRHIAENSKREKLISLHVFCSGRFVPFVFKKASFWDITVDRNYLMMMIFFAVQLLLVFWSRSSSPTSCMESESMWSLKATCHEMISKRESWSLDQFQDQCSAITVSEH